MCVCKKCVKRVCVKRVCVKRVCVKRVFKACVCKEYMKRAKTGGNPPAKRLYRKSVSTPETVVLTRCPGARDVSRTVSKVFHRQEKKCEK